MTLLALAFLNPTLLFALPLVAVPIIIHILNRRRYQQRRWAAMEFLLAALKRNRKRMALEQWIVLLLRTLAVALLIFLVTRPQLSDDLLGRQRMHHVLCLDDSASMAQRDGATNTFRHALDISGKLIANLAERRTGDLLTVLRSSRPTQPDLLSARIDADLGSRVRELLNSFTVGSDVADLATVVQEAEKRAAEAKEAPRAELLLVTDFRVIDWLSTDGKPRPELATQLARLDPAKTQIRVVQVGPRDSENVGIVDVVREGRVGVEGIPTKIAVQLHNFGIEVSEALDLAVDIDGRTRVTRTVEPLAPGEQRKLVFEHVFAQAGFHGVTASLPTDRFPIDDRRGGAMRIREHSNVLLVDGAPGDGDESEVHFLQAALEPGNDTPSGVAVQVVSDHGLVDRDLRDLDMIWLCNLATPSEATVAKLEEFIAGGGGLALSAGDQIDPIRYNQVLYRNGDGILPCALGDLGGDLEKPDRAFVSERQHPVVSATIPAEVLDALFANKVLIGRHLAALEDQQGRAKVILRLQGSSGPALLVSRGFRNGGQVLWFGTTIDKAWTNLPATDAFLLLAQQIHQFATRAHEDGAINLGPRGELRYELDPSVYRPDVIVRGVEEGAEERTFTVALDAKEQNAQSPIRIAMAELQSLGLYEARLSLHDGNTERRMFARNAPVDESKLQRLSQATLFKAFPTGIEDRLAVTEAEQTVQSMQKQGEGEIWRVLGLLLLAVLLLESLLAWKFGRR